MELVANVWPVADSLTGLVQRYLMRAYALEADDATISDTLTALAPSDYPMARAFVIPDQFREVSPHGTLTGCVSLALFHHYQFTILDPAFRWWESAHATLQGISMTGGEPAPRRETPLFAEDPYLVVTVLLELPDGRLIPQLPNS
jgi:hypothetical protein